MNGDRIRCPWAARTALEQDYHDNEWGVPQHDDLKLFELLILEGAQAGLSWITILRKRSDYREAFEGLIPGSVANFDEDKIASLMKNKGIIRNRKKILSAINNAQAFMRVQDQWGSFDEYLWRFVGGCPTTHVWSSMSDMPVSTPTSERLSRDLKNRGFSFVGPVICYSYMQAVGMVNDHVSGCYRIDSLG
jgi:DNA-3-methyladenine glycosylase I